MKTSTRPRSSTLAGEAAEEAFSPPASDFRPAPTPPAHQEVAERARALWKKYGCPSGRDEEIWLEAERQLAGSGSSFDGTASPHGGGRRAARDDDQGLVIGAAPGSAARGSRRRAV